MLLMAILNRTPDSFSDAGSFLGDNAAVARIAEVIAGGAAIVDIGAESTRPGASPVPAATQIERLGDIIRYAATCDILVSVDTTCPDVAEKAILDGATIVNSASLATASARPCLRPSWGCARPDALPL